MGRPAYHRIADELRRGILEGRYRPGDAMPSENELAAAFDSSRITTRKSLGLLETEGFVAAWQGKGYYVRRPEHNKYTLYFEKGGESFDFKIQQVTVASPSPEVRRALGLDGKRRVVLIRRIVLKGGLPVACDEKYIPYHRGDPFVEVEIRYADLPEIVAAKSSPFAIRTDMEIGVEAASGAVMAALGCGNGEPLLVAFRYISDIEGRRVGYEKTYMTSAYGRMRASSGYIFAGGEGLADDSGRVSPAAGPTDTGLEAGLEAGA